MAEVVRIDGLKEIEAATKALRDALGVKTGGIIIRALRKGAKVIRDDARRRTPPVPSGFVPGEIQRKGKRAKSFASGLKSTDARRRGLLRSNIIEHAIPTSSRLANGNPTVLIRVRAHGYTRINGKLVFNRPGSSPGWWWWLEFGTAKTPARPFMRPAFEAQKLVAIEEFKAAAREEIELMWIKHGMRRAA